MIHEKIVVEERNAELETFFLSNSEFNANRKRPTVIICPGGGYEHLSLREGEPVAVRMNALGFNAAVLKYSLAPMTFPAALLDLAVSVSQIRQKADFFGIDKNKIVVCGFSAGAHLAGLLGAYWNSDLLTKKYSLDPQKIQPNALVLCYPVICAQNFCHENSILNVLGEKFKRKRSLVSLEKLVTKDFPRVFMWHTNGDKSVVAENSLIFARALREKNIPFEYHLFSRGCHGLSLADSSTNTVGNEYIEKQCQIWPQLFKTWFSAEFFDYDGEF